MYQTYGIRELHTCFIKIDAIRMKKERNSLPHILFVDVSSFFVCIFFFLFSSAQSFCSNRKSYPSIYSSPSSSGTSPQSGEISKSCSKDRSTHWDKYSICTCCLWRKYGHVCAFACKNSFSVPPSPAPNYCVYKNEWENQLVNILQAFSALYFKYVGLAGFRSGRAEHHQKMRT